MVWTLNNFSCKDKKRTVTNIATVLYNLVMLKQKINICSIQVYMDLQL